MDKSWKAYERRIAAFVSGKRRGADYGGRTGGKDDIIHPLLSIECKLYSRVTYGLLLAAVDQAEANAEEGKIPVAVIKRKRDRDLDSLVVLKLRTALTLLPGGEGE